MDMCSMGKQINGKIQHFHMLSWKDPIRISESNSWPCTGHLKFSVLRSFLGFPIH